MIVGNTLVFRDDNHVTTEYSQLLAPVIGALADRPWRKGESDEFAMNEFANEPRGAAKRVTNERVLEVLR